MVKIPEFRKNPEDWDACLLINAKRQAGKLRISSFKSFGLNRPGNRVQVYRLRGGRSNHYPTRGYIHHATLFNFILCILYNFLQ